MPIKLVLTIRLSGNSIVINQSEKMNDKHRLASKLLAWHDHLANNRKATERVWGDIATYIRPERNVFTGRSIHESAKNIFDSTAILASEFLASSLWTMVSSSANEWFQIKPKNAQFLACPEVSEWFTQVNQAMKSELLDAQSGFYHKSYEFYSDLVCFGTAIFYVGENTSTGQIEYSCKNLAYCYLDFGPTGNIDVVFRRVYLTAEAAVGYFGLSNLPEHIVAAYQSGSEENFMFLHAVMPRECVSNYYEAATVKPYVSFYLEPTTARVISEGGYNECPYIVARWFTSPHQIYGESPSMLVLPDIKMLNAISKSTIVALQKQVDPPLLAPNEAAVQGIKTNPGGIIYGGLDPITGNQLFKPLINPMDLSGINETQEQKRSAIKEAFYFSWLVSSYNTNATATEVLSVNEQRMQLLGSKIARIQTEFLYPLLVRQFNVMRRLHKFPELPAHNTSAMSIDADFYGLWNRYQQLSESVGLDSLISQLGRLQALGVDMKDKVDWQSALQIIAQGHGVPSGVMCGFNVNNKRSLHA